MTETHGIRIRGDADDVAPLVLVHEHPADGVGVVVDMSTNDFADKFQQ